MCDIINFLYASGEAAEHFANLISGMDNVIQHVDAVKEFVEMCQGPTIDFPGELVK